MKINNNTFEHVQPSIDIQRSTWRMPYDHKTTFNEGELVPFYCGEVIPGDTFSIQTSSLVRLSTLLTPIMNDLYLDTYYFFVPNRLIWEHWINLMGENTATAGIPETEYSVPQLTTGADTSFKAGSVADHFGLPTGVHNLSVNALPFRAYAKIYTDWFRDQNLQSPSDTSCIFYQDDTSRGVDSSSASLGGDLLKVCKMHDYFTSALPYPQKHADVTLPIGTDANIYYKDLPDTFPSGYTSTYQGEQVVAWKASNIQGTSLGTPTGQPFRDNTGASLQVDLSSMTATTINQLRLAFQMQKLYEKDARSGSRYIETIKSHFNTTCPDYRLQRSEYLGGNRQLINIQSIYQSSGTMNMEGMTTTPQGNVAAYSVTFGSDNSFLKSFTEHGFIIGLCCVRHKHVYQQGIEKYWTRKDRLDYYFPVLANIGEQPIYNREIYAQGTSADSEVFGYQEAWADYRYKPSCVTGEFRSNYAQPLDSWHLADNYTDQPILNNEWIKENSNTLNRCLAVNTHAQFLADFSLNIQATRPMPLYSVPGLIDHH